MIRICQQNIQQLFCLSAKPVLIDKIVDIKDGIGFVIFKIFLYSNPKPFLMKWYDNDQPLNGLIVVNSTFLETTVEISVYGTNVNVTGYSVFLQTKHMPLLSSTIYKCHIENSLGFINVVFNDLNTPESESDMQSKSTMVIPSIKTETSMLEYTVNCQQIVYCNFQHNTYSLIS